MEVSYLRKWKKKLDWAHIKQSNSNPSLCESSLPSSKCYGWDIRTKFKMHNIFTLLKPHWNDALQIDNK